MAMALSSFRLFNPNNNNNNLTASHSTLPAFGNTFSSPPFFSILACIFEASDSPGFSQQGAFKAVKHFGSFTAMPKLKQPWHLCFSMPSISSKPSDKEIVEEARKSQLEATELLAEFLKSDNMERTAELHLDSLTEDFFLVASTYMSLAKKEGNAEVVSKLESLLKVAQKVKEKTLRPEIQLLNQLLRDKGTAERRKTIENNMQYLNAASYFFQLLRRMIDDVEKQHGNPQRLKLLTQLRVISGETKDFSRSLKKGR